MLVDIVADHIVYTYFIYITSNLFETRQMFLLLFFINKDKFWFLLMLRTSSAKVWQNKLSREVQIAQPPGSNLDGMASKAYLEEPGKPLFRIAGLLLCDSLPFP